MGFTIDDDTVLLKLKLKVQEIPQDDETMTQCHNMLAKYLTDYIPMREGMLFRSAKVTPQYVEYDTPYAHYMYEGIVYGPNIPIIEDGVIVGWFSPPGQKKYPTGDRLNYSTEGHQLATHHWEQAMMKDKGEEFTNAITDIIVKNLDKE